MTPSSASLSADEARRVALAAQGFANAPKLRKRRPFDPALDRLHVLQIDSVNVFSRSHYVPIFSRHGSYDLAALDRLLWESGEYTEYWAHEAAFIPIADRPLFGWRMDEFRAKHLKDWRTQAAMRTVEVVREKLASGGPQFVRELEDEARPTRTGPWWGWSEVKRAVEWLFATGEAVSVGRVGFQRQYALAEQVLPGELLAPVRKEDAQRALIARAACALGVGTLADLADYHRMKSSDARVAISDLQEAGELVPVTVRGWTTAGGKPEAAWMHRDAVVPGRLAPDALLTPFDPITWFRPRTERIFDFHYRIEIYTPKERRRYGYYCLPLMVGGRLAGRIDLKADRAARELLVQAAWQEDRAPARTAEAAVSLLARAAAWQGLESVSVSGAGNLPLPARFDVEA